MCTILNYVPARLFYGLKQLRSVRRGHRRGARRAVLALIIFFCYNLPVYAAQSPTFGTVTNASGFNGKYTAGLLVGQHAQSGTTPYIIRKYPSSIDVLSDAGVPKQNFHITYNPVTGLGTIEADDSSDVPGVKYDSNSRNRLLIHYDFDIPIFMYLIPQSDVAIQSLVYEFNFDGTITYNFTGSKAVTASLYDLHFNLSAPDHSNIVIYQTAAGVYRITCHDIYATMGGLPDLILHVSYTVPYSYKGDPNLMSLNWLLAEIKLNNFTLQGSRLSLYDGGVLPSDFTVQGAIDQQTAQQQQYHDQDRADATSAGSAMTGFASQLNNLKGKWEILWYPITFTNTVLSVFTQGSAATAYASTYGMIEGYTYNEETGCLDPVMRTGPPVATIASTGGATIASTGGATITFPAYTLPVLNVKLWDSYTYDLGALKTQYSALFDALYVVITILEVFWFVSFLREKYEEVFG